MLQTIVYSFLFSALIFAATALFFGKEKATFFPGSAVMAAFILTPWWMALVCALVGHFGTALLAKKFL